MFGVFRQGTVKLLTVISNVSYIHRAYPLLSTSLKHSSVNKHTFSILHNPELSITRSGSLHENSDKLFLNPKRCSLLNISSIILHQSQKRNVIVNSEKTGTKVSCPEVLARFKPLGNRLWLKRQAGYRKRLWKKYLKSGNPRKVYRLKRHVLCSVKDTKLLGKMVTEDWKKQRWTVTDPYAGYDLYSKFYYNPFNMPGVNSGKNAEMRDYNWQRYNETLKRNKQTKYHHKRRVGISNRQKPLLKYPYFH